MNLKLAGKVAVVTGGGQGIGRAIALALAKEQVKVVIADMNREAAQAVCKEIEALNQVAGYFAVDVTDKESVNEMVQSVLDKYNKIDILVNSAGLITISDVIDLREEDWDKVMSVNAKGVFLTCQAVLEHMIKNQNGKIINIASQAGKTGFPHEAHYSASKGAVIVFTQALAREVAKHKINVNAVCPGSIETEMNITVTEGTAKILGVSTDEKIQMTINSTPLSRKGTPDDIAPMVVFLASHYTDFMTGQAINITGGRELH
ncbi:MAG: SDR family NAD(P)-dependent oxidoreductase [Saccharofermentanales bacterium]